MLRYVYVKQLVNTLNRIDSFYNYNMVKNNVTQRQHFSSRHVHWDYDTSISG